MIVYNFIDFKGNEKQTEFKRKRALSDKVFKQCEKKKYEYHPIIDFTGFLMHIHLSNKLNEKFVIVAESKDILPNIGDEPYEFIKTDDFLK